MIVKVKARGKGNFVDYEIRQAGGVKINYPVGSRYELWLEVMQVDEEKGGVIGKMNDGKKMFVPNGCILDFMQSGDFCQYEAKATQKVDDLVTAQSDGAGVNQVDMT